MILATRFQRCVGVALLTALAGCALPADHSLRNPPPVALASAPAPLAGTIGAPRAPAAMVPVASPVSYQAPAGELPAPPRFGADSSAGQFPGIGPGPNAATGPEARLPEDPCDPFAAQAELSVERLVAEVLARNPSLQAATAAWRAAAERYPQVVSLEDPMFGWMIGPRGIGRDEGGGWMAEASQRVPWAGKRALRGCAAQAEADAMRGEIGDTRLRLSEAARMAFSDYYLARREAEVNASTRTLLAQFREIAKNKYEVNQTTVQDVLQADVELANLEGRRTEVARDENVAIARINTLLHRAPNCPLPPPPARIAAAVPLPSAEELQQAALRSRPDLFAQQARIRAEEANLGLACKEYYPDLNLRAKYDAFMPEDMRPQVGMDLNVPIRYARRSAAVQEASDRLAQRRAEYQDRLDQVRFEVQSALARAAQSQRVIGLYEERILPATQRSLESAQANYTSGKLDFLRLIDAQRQVYTQREMYHRTIAEYHRRLAELERAVGETFCNGR